MERNSRGAPKILFFPLVFFFIAGPWTFVTVWLQSCLLFLEPSFLLPFPKIYVYRAYNIFWLGLQEAADIQTAYVPITSANTVTNSVKSEWIAVSQPALYTCELCWERAIVLNGGWVARLSS